MFANTRRSTLRWSTEHWSRSTLTCEIHADREHEESCKTNDEDITSDESSFANASGPVMSTTASIIAGESWPNRFASVTGSHLLGDIRHRRADLEEARSLGGVCILCECASIILTWPQGFSRGETSKLRLSGILYRSQRRKA